MQALAPDSGTLIVVKAAPLHREPFLLDDTEPRREFAPAEESAWQQAQRKIATHW